MNKGARTPSSTDGNVESSCRGSAGGDRSLINLPILFGVLRFRGLQRDGECESYGKSEFRNVCPRLVPPHTTLVPWPADN